MSLLENNINKLQEAELNRRIDDRALAVLKKYLAETGFTSHKITDTPTDALSVVPRKYVNLNGTLANRPTSSVAVMGQRYFATDTNISMTYNASSSVWTNGVGSVVAQG